VRPIERWRALLPGWGIPEEIVAAAPESPWGFPPELLAARAETARTLPDSVALGLARAALTDGGTVLDVGVGGGAASLPLAPPARRIVGVDTSEDLLARFVEGARSHGVEAVAVRGMWPDAETRVGRCDVAVCAHVLYNVPELEPFVAALDRQAARRVVIEITAEHPLAWMSDLWMRFHGLERPDGPTADDAERAIADLGLDVRREDETRPSRSSGFARRGDAVALIRRRLCLTPDRDDEVAEALGDRLSERDGLWSAGPPEQRVTALWWDVVEGGGGDERRRDG
jgi:SAM-dependent methyltransferase